MEKFVRIREGYVTNGLYCKRGLGTHARRPQQLLVTINIMRFIKNAIQPSISNAFDQSMLWAACCLGFFGFLRSSEFTLPSSNSFSSSQTLLHSDIDPDSRNSLYVRIKMSKVDPFRRGHILVIAPSQSHICAVDAMRRFLCHRQDTNGPLFLFKDGTFLTGSHLNMLLSAWMVPRNLVHTHISLHSFHIGAASTAAAAGLPAWLIQALGRWSSQCCTRYIRMFPAIIASVPNKLVRTISPNGPPNCGV